MADDARLDIDSSETLHGWARDLFPICRSLSGAGVRQTLDYLGALLPGLAVHAIESGSHVFDWTVPDEWNIRDAYVADESGRRVIDFKTCNLHVVGYSEPVDRWMTREELEPHLYSLPAQPEAIPYVTSYYTRRWGFCLSQTQRDTLPAGRYHVVIDASLAPGVLNYADLLIPGDTPEEVLLSTYVCHPSMANNELSGPVIATALARWLRQLPSRRYSYRIVFVPETIGAIIYLSRHLEHLRRHVKAGFVLTCMGDERAWSYMPSRYGNTLTDRVARAVLRESGVDYTAYSFLERGSDERQYCSPGVDLPICSIMRSKYGCYPEYHTSLDDLALVTPTGLADSFAMMRRCLHALEHNHVYRNLVPCEPQLGKRGLYPTVSTRDSGATVRGMMNVLAYADGTNDMPALAEITGQRIADCIDWCEKLHQHGLLERITTQ